jgi:hypothetical protein
MVGWLHWRLGVILEMCGWEPAVVVWCPVAKGQQLLVQVPPPAHLIKEAPTSIHLIKTPLSCSGCKYGCRT